MKNKYLECAEVAGTHGVRGAMRLQSRCDSPEVLASLKTLYILRAGEYQPIKVLHASLQKNMVLVTLDGVDTIEAAAAMRGAVLYADREDFNLGEDDYFIADLIGLPVLDFETGESYGELAEVLSPGAHQVYLIKSGGGDFMIPCVPEFVREIVVTDGEKQAGIYVSLIEGMREGGNEN